MGWTVNKRVGKKRGSETRQLVSVIKDEIKAGRSDRKIARELVEQGISTREIVTALRLNLRNSR